jgi:hypothetical protein
MNYRAVGKLESAASINQRADDSVVNDRRSHETGALGTPPEKDETHAGGAAAGTEGAHEMVAIVSDTCAI